MLIKIAKNIGECFGVSNIIENAKEIIGNNPNKNIFIFGSVVHNENLVNTLKADNVIFIPFTTNISDLEMYEISSEDIVIFSAHGHTINIENYMKSRTDSVFDFTCPIVKTNERLMLNHKNDRCILIGSEDHEECKNAISENENLIIINPKKEFEFSISNEEKKTYIFSQTTLATDEISSVLKTAREIVFDLIDKTSLCKEVDTRQLQLIQAKNQYDFILVCGEKISSNTRKLYEIARGFVNCEVYLVEDLKVLNDIPFEKESRIFITSGTSCGKSFVRDVIEKLGEIENNFIE